MTTIGTYFPVWFEAKPETLRKLLLKILSFQEEKIYIII